jgi:hypothetical protein
MEVFGHYTSMVLDSKKEKFEKGKIRKRKHSKKEKFEKGKIRKRKNSKKEKFEKGKIRQSYFCRFGTKISNSHFSILNRYFLVVMYTLFRPPKPRGTTSGGQEKNDFGDFFQSASSSSASSFHLGFAGASRCNPCR